MSFLVEDTTKTGPLNILQGTQSTSAARLGERIDEALGTSHHVTVSSFRLSQRLHSVPDEHLTISTDLESGVLDLQLFSERTPKAPDLEALVASLLPELINVVLVRNFDSSVRILGGARDDISQFFVPTVRDVEPEHLQQFFSQSSTPTVVSVRVSDLIRLGEDLFSAPHISFDLEIDPSASIPQVAAVSRWPVPVRKLTIVLDGTPRSVAIGTLAASAWPQSALEFAWSPHHDEDVKTRTLPQLSLAFAASPAFASWATRYQALCARGVSQMRQCRAVAGSRVVVASRQTEVAPTLLSSDALVFCLPENSGSDIGQQNLFFHPTTPSEAHSIQSGPFSVELLGYSAPPGDSDTQHLRSIQTSQDLHRFLSDADSARHHGVWLSASDSAIESECAWLNTPCDDLDQRALFVEEQGVRATRRSSLIPWYEVDSQLQVLTTQAQETRRRRGCETCEQANHCGACPSVPVAFEKDFCTARRSRPWIAQYVTALRLRQTYGSNVRISGFPSALLTDHPLAASADWLVAADGDITYLAQISGTRRVLQVPRWAGAYVESRQATSSHEDAVSDAARLGATDKQCTDLANQLGLT